MRQRGPRSSHLLGRAACMFILAFAQARAYGQNDAPGGELKMGRWVGHVEIDGRSEAFAATLETHIVQPDDAALFPRLEAILKLSLGGYSGGEYDSEIYEDIQYDFNTGLLTFDEAASDLTISALVYPSPHRIEGQVFSRSTAQAGRIRLEYADDDEPGDDGDSDEDGVVGRERAFTTPTLVPSLAGQYEGECAGRRAILQIEAGRGFDAGSDVPGLKQYSIRGAFGLEDNSLCYGLGGIGRPNWCVDRAYTSGTYNFLLGQLVLSGGLGTDSCELGDAGTLVCNVRIRDANRTCRLRKTSVATTPFFKGEQLYFIRTTADQRRALPEPSAPLHADLLAALGGSFSGYLYHETKDQYQPLKINVVSSRSTPNPHNENGVYVSATAVLHFGSTASSDFWPHQLDRRPFYLRPGFILHSEGTDAALQITDWRMGVISGTWYSKAFGRVGTFQLVKSSELPPLSADARFVPSIVGDFRGPRDRAAGTYDLWWLQTVVPVQPRDPGRSVVNFQGQYQMFTDTIPWPRRRLQLGTYDVYAGQISFMTEADLDNPTFVFGTYNDRDSLKIFWPGAQKWGVGFFDFALNHYARVGE